MADLHSRSTDDLVSDEQRRRIIQEEEFRRVTAERMEREHGSRLSRFARQLNSPIMLWLLSTVVVGLISLGYKNWQDEKLKRAQEEEHKSKTSAELYYRVSACDDIGPAADREEVESMYNGIIGLRPLYPDYQNTRLEARYLKFCHMGAACPVVPDSLLRYGERIRRVTKLVVFGVPVGKHLRDRSFLSQLRKDCDQLIPVKQSIRNLLAIPPSSR